MTAFSRGNSDSRSKNNSMSPHGRHIFIILVMLILLLTAALVIQNDFMHIASFFSISQDEEKTSTIITEEIEKLCDFSTVKYNYQSIVAYSDKTKIGELTIPEILGGKKVILTYRAYIKGGCRLVSAALGEEKTVKVVLSPGTILDNVLIVESISIYDVQQGIFNKFKIDEDTDLIHADMLKYAAENQAEIQKSAEKNAAEMIRGFLAALGYQEIDIVFSPSVS